MNPELWKFLEEWLKEDEEISKNDWFTSGEISWEEYWETENEN